MWQCALAPDLAQSTVLLKVGAFYALDQKKAPCTDLGPLIRTVVQAFGAMRCMWESDGPFQVAEGHTYQARIDLVRQNLTFLTDDDRDWLLRKTAERFYFPKR
jgi:predicted TIM-barrel fold metal-dependent hydrolase